MPAFSKDCVECPRLASHLAHVRERYAGYYGRPVAPFGDPGARLLIVGLAPGLHGANRTGRPFTGDYAGILLYQTLYDHGFANRPDSVSRTDGLMLINCRITNAVKCLPPGNKPTPEEVRTCNRYLATELAGLPANTVVLVLGQVAHHAVVQACGLKQNQYPFGHGLEHALPTGHRMLCSYHCSRYNTQTRRLTPAMFQGIMARARQLLSLSE